ncbi:MAG: CPBP family intramembrane glutamic endopeptidase [Candidatus Limnocylindrales bacterium]|jgi:membrane protease YdiL (CAAX protease family)
MTSDTLRIITAVAVLLMLVLLRLQAEAFGAAEYDEPDNRYHRGGWTRLAWYVLGLLLVAVLYSLHPQPHDVLYLVMGNHLDVLTFGLSLAAIGVAQAAVFAWFRYGELRLPGPRAYPGAALNSVATAIIDEAAFRGAVQGMLLAAGLPEGFAILAQTILYTLATRTAAPGRHRYMMMLSLGMGLVFGWVTIKTGGIGAAILGHTVTSFALFVCTGHAGHVARRGAEPEEREALRLPDGWRDARPREEASSRDEAH